MTRADEKSGVWGEELGFQNAFECLSLSLSLSHSLGGAKIQRLTCGKMLTCAKCAPYLLCGRVSGGWRAPETTVSRVLISSKRVLDTPYVISSQRLFLTVGCGDLNPNLSSPPYTATVMFAVGFFSHRSVVFICFDGVGAHHVRFTYLPLVYPPPTGSKDPDHSHYHMRTIPYRQKGFDLHWGLLFY